MRRPPLISIVIPAHNEEGNINRIHSAIRTNTERYPTEVIFVDDGSRDDTAAKVRSLQSDDPTVRLLRLTRNFGHQAALLAGLQAAHGEAVITMDCDLQHPPELLPQMLEAWEKGAPLVQMLRRDTEKATRFKKWTSAGFYRFLQLLSESPVVLARLIFSFWIEVLSMRSLPSVTAVLSCADWLAGSVSLRTRSNTLLRPGTLVIRVIHSTRWCDFPWML